MEEEADRLNDFSPSPEPVDYDIDMAEDEPMEDESVEEYFLRNAQRDLDCQRYRIAGILDWNSFLVSSSNGINRAITEETEKVYREWLRYLHSQSDSYAVMRAIISEN